MGGPPELALAALLPALGSGLASLGSGLWSGLGSLLGSPATSVGGQLATGLGMQGIHSLLGKGGQQGGGLMGMAPPSQSPQFRQPALNLGGQAQQAPQMQVPQMQVPQQVAMPQIGQMPQTPYQFGIPDMPQITPIKQPAGITPIELAQSQAAFPGPQPPYAPQHDTGPDQYTQLLNYLRMNDLA